MKFEKIEEYKFCWANSSFENEPETVIRLCAAILHQALSDWKEIGDQTIVYKANQAVRVRRSEILEFMNGSFLDEILTVAFPWITQEELCDHIRDQTFKMQRFYTKTKKKQTKKRRCDRHSDVTGK